MKVLVTILVIIAVLIAGIAVFLGYMGAFGNVEVSERREGPFVIVYESATGPYQEVAVLMERLEGELAEAGIEPQRGIGIFYDAPAEAGRDETRYVGGHIISEEDYAALMEVEYDFSLARLPASNCVAAEFPLKNTASFFIGAAKVYPALSVYIEEGGYQPCPAIEIYSRSEGKVTYLFPVGMDRNMIESLLE